MVGNVIDGKLSGQHDIESYANVNRSMSTSQPPTKKAGTWSADDKEKIILSATLCLVVGIIQVKLKVQFCTFFSLFHKIVTLPIPRLWR